MNKEDNHKLDYVYRIANYIDGKYEPEGWEGFDIIKAYHDYVHDHASDPEGDFRDLRVIVELEHNGAYDSSPIRLIQTMRGLGMEVKTTTVVWEKGEMHIVFVPRGFDA